MNKRSAALHMQAKILANAMYGFSTLTTPKGFNLGSFFDKEFRVIDDCLPIKYQLIMSVHDATALVNYTNANKNLYCWWTIKHRSGYYAVGPHINKLVIKELELSNDDPIEYFEKGAIVKCDHYKPKMKGGHRENAYMNSVSRKLYRSKAKRRKLRKQRDVTRRFVKTNKGPVGINFAFRYLYKDVKNADDVVKAAWETVPDFNKLSQVKKVKQVNSAPVTKLSDHQGKLMCTPF